MINELLEFVKILRKQIPISRATHTLWLEHALEVASKDYEKLLKNCGEDPGEDEENRSLENYSLEELLNLHDESVSAKGEHGCPFPTCQHRRDNTIECWYTEAQNSRTLIKVLRENLSEQVDRRVKWARRFDKAQGKAMEYHRKIVELENQLGTAKEAEEFLKAKIDTILKEIMR